MEVYKYTTIILLILLFIICSNTFFQLLNKTFHTYHLSTKNAGITHTIVINLHETLEGQRRWKLMSQHPIIKGPLVRFPAVYGKNHDFTPEIQANEIQTSWDYGAWKGKKENIRHMDSGELGVSLSHLRLWKKIAKMPERSRVLVLEDDAIRVDPHFYEKTELYKKHLPADWDVFLLGFWLHRGDDSDKVNKYIARVRTFVLTHAYIIRPKGARALLKQLPIDKPLDTWMSYQSNYVNIYRHYDTRRTISMKEPKRPRSILIRQQSQQSEIVHTNNWIEKR